MRGSAIRRWSITGALSVLAGVASVAVETVPAAAAGLPCGTVITTSTTLTADVGPCSSDGLVIGADNVTLNLAGHSVSGVPNHPGNGAGIISEDHSGVVIMGGTVQSFDAGVAILGGSGNTVQRMVLTHNVGTSETDFGDGVAIAASDGNTIQYNTVSFNGPYDGIGLFNVSSHNTIRYNVISDNNFPRFFGPHGEHETIEDDGIRVEPGSTFNAITNNSVTRSGLDGIALFVQSTDNTVVGNVVTANGFHDPTINRLGAGIRVFLQADRSLIQNNIAFGNAGAGIGIDSKSNTIVHNLANGNGIIDLRDSNPACDNNQWHANFGTNVDPPCTLTP
jgi:parallel beta-helix repeat protein